VAFWCSIAISGEGNIVAKRKAWPTVESLTAVETVIGRLPGETSCLTLVWAVLDRASAGWRGLNMTSDGLRLLQYLRRSLLEPPRQLRPRTTRPGQPADTPDTVSTVA
jgi:hypothetical protein